jgi:hypothetical protein
VECAKFHRWEMKFHACGLAGENLTHILMKLSRFVTLFSVPMTQIYLVIGTEKRIALDCRVLVYSKLHYPNRLPLHFVILSKSSYEQL